MSTKNSIDTIGKPTCDLPTYLNQLRQHVTPLNPVRFDLVPGCVFDLVRIRWLKFLSRELKTLPSGTTLTEFAIWLTKRRRNFNNNMAQYRSHSYCEIRSLMVGVPFAVRTQILLYASLLVPKPEYLLPRLPECNLWNAKLSSGQHEVKKGSVSISPLIFKLSKRWR